MHRLAVIGVGNMAKAVIGGMVRSNIQISDILLFDRNTAQYDDLKVLPFDFTYSDSIKDAVTKADLVLLSVKPQNYNEVFSEITEVEKYSEKTYISIAAGIKAEEVSLALGGAGVIRVLPNIPMVIGQGVSLVCRNPLVDKDFFEYVSSLFASSGSVMVIDEFEMNRLISVTSSSPAYVFRFINAIYQGAVEQGLDASQLLDVICDVVIGSAMLLKGSSDTPLELCSKVASKGGTTEQALKMLDTLDFDGIISKAMKACTVRADELGAQGK